ncbi:uncharacterized protein Tco025E_04643 [Trypanosoma conorhini]|uniref:Uncharacterized protein n=1 Tax=Trypanosoma conorhini TaxID=83891 RepID=A0A422PKA8_9TRYP|nr:uncharacterized protein Tco025E_04643 [Trypanosoma conorhini]RNF18140.1 hypothetical protein Tco025E_04643 [Trypanosoma conorhini]
MMRRVFAGLRCLVALPSLGDPAGRCSARAVASYPSPGSSRGAARSGRKKYNFLNSKRLVETEKGLRSRRAIRMRDDVFFHRRVRFREAINQSIEKEIRYFPENVKQYVFFKNKAENSSANGFHGMRKAPGCVHRRILHLVEDAILKPEHRGHLLELIEGTGTLPPTAEEWARYTDETGRITINVYHHHFVEQYLRSFCTGKKCLESHRPLQAFLMLNRNNFDVCPPLRTWSLRQGPVRDEELVERGTQMEVRDIIAELTAFQRSNVMQAYEKLTPKEKEALVEEAESKREALRHEYERERLFGSKLMCGVTALKEVRSMTSPAITYYNEEYYKYVIRCGGSAEATLRRSKDEVPSWFTLAKEVRTKYYCFGTHNEMHPVSGAHLYIRYCSRDYGMSREQSMERWSELSDLQKAALNFCFYAPISAPRRSSTAFRRFYYKQCHRHGLVMTGKACSNHAFLKRVRRIWMSMSADERAQYEETESFSSVFPLQPSSSLASTVKGGKAAATPSTLEPPPAAPSASTTVVAAQARRGVRTPVTISAMRRAEEENMGEEEDDMFYFNDEIISDDVPQQETQKYAAKPLSHTKLPALKEKHVVFTI